MAETFGESLDRLFKERKAGVILDDGEDDIDFLFELFTGEKPSTTSTADTQPSDFLLTNEEIDKLLGAVGNS